MRNEFNAANYEETVECIAKEALQEHGNANDREEFIRESVDGNAYVIYYAGADVVKDSSSNYGNDWQTVHALAGENADDDQLKQVAAYEAMIQDVHDKVREIQLDWSKCDNCGKWYDSDDVNEGGECSECKGDFCNDCLTEAEDGADVCEDCKERLEEPTREEDDAFIVPAGYLGSKTVAWFGTTRLDLFNSDDEALDAIRKAGREAKFYPNVWSISDHGHEHLIEGFNWDQ